MSRSAFLSTLLATAVLLAAVLAFDSSREALEGQEAGAGHIGYVDVSKVYNGYNRVIDRKQELETLYNGQIDRLKKDQERLDKEKADLELMNREGPAYLQKIKDFQERAYKVRYELQLTQREFALDVDGLTRETYLEILRELETYVKRNGYQLVFKIDGDLLIDDPSVDPMQYVANRQILFFAKQRDITQPLLDQLNRNYIRKPR